MTPAEAVSTQTVLSPARADKIASLLEFVYPEHDAGELLKQLEGILRQYSSFKSAAATSTGGRLWSEKDTLLITYADSLRASGKMPLQVLKSFLDENLQGKIKNVHLLPFYPWTSDDGFSVADYLAVDPNSGDWDDVLAVGKNFDLMFDLVLNHCSASHQWFKDYLAGKDYAQKYFIESDPALDHSQVVRPRSLPLLTEVDTAKGKKHVWTTFSSDQIDLNYKSPELFMEIVKIFMEYIKYGARIVRFDAPTYLWKELGTSCVSLPQTHAVMKIIRQVFDEVAPGCVVLTETNVPHLENISYFGDGDEAQMVYNFSLPPLLLHALRTEDSTYLKKWAATLDGIPEGCTFLNFTSSHDGIGVRGLKDIVPDQDIDALVQQVQDLGGKISTRRLSDGTDTPYEMNITYFDALGFGKDTISQQHIDRFLSSQLVSIAFKGVPAIYIQNLIGGRNDYAGLAKTGRARSINRKQWDIAELNKHLAEETPKTIFASLQRFLELRSNLPALSPLAKQTVLDTSSAIFAIKRECAEGKLISVTNVTGKSVDFTSPIKGSYKELLSGKSGQDNITVPAYGTVWLTY